MTSLPFIDIVSENAISKPQLAKTVSQPPSLDELDAIEISDYGLINPQSLPNKYLSIEAQTPTTDGHATPRTSVELDESQPSTAKLNEAMGIVPSWSYPKTNKWRHLAACIEYFGNGLNDASPGALIPYIESWYHIGYAVVSLIWVSNAIGFILAAFCADFINGKIGRAKSLMVSEVFLIAAYIVIACPVPFPVVVVAYMVIGFGEALSLALNNVFISNLANPTVLLGTAHGAYGVGGIVGPIVATALVSNGVNWHKFYALPLVIRVLCMAFAGWSFWDFEKDETTQFSNSLVEIASQQTASEPRNTSKFRSIAKAFKHRTTIIGACFIFAYQGIEVSESGWFISYLIDYRNADPAHVGYVTSGFWAGITLGRFTLTYAARRIGEKRFVFGLGVGVIAFQLLAWFIPNIIGESLAVAVVGLLLGPIAPCAQAVWARLLPSRVQVFAIGFISSAGSSGGAVVPFLTGLLAQVVGTFVLHPICIGFCVIMLGFWAALPALDKRRE